MYSRIIKPPETKSFFLFGPRGTGKTTWVKTAFPSAIYIDLLEASLFNDLLANPQRLEKLIPDGFKDWVVIDEVQKIPELLDEVHRLIEKKGYKFILTGSSARKLRKKGHNLLAGRALTCHFYPLTVKELGQNFDLQHSLKYGQLPCSYTEKEPQKYLESYIQTYLKEEIQQEGLTRNLGAFSRFLEAASFSQGSILNASSVSRECAVERKVVENYFSILEDLLIAYKLPVFSKKAKRKLAVHSKFYFFDAGVYRTLRPMGPLDTPEEAQGMALETIMLQEIAALNDYLDAGYKIYYWRTLSNMEVDFVLYGERGIKAIEIKRTGRVQDAMLKGLKTFASDYPMAKLYFVYGGEKRMWDGTIEIVPIVEFLRDLEKIL